MMKIMKDKILEILFRSLALLCQLFIVLKFFGLITWPWLAVVSPAFVLALALVGLFLWHVWVEICRQA